MGRVDHRGDSVRLRPHVEVRATVDAAGDGKAFHACIAGLTSLWARLCLAVSAGGLILGGLSIGLHTLCNVVGWYAGEQVFTLLIIAGFLFFLPSLIVFGSLYEWLRQRKRAEALVRFARCGACGYPLGGHEAESDGCTVCPECSAAWRVPERSDA